jgi:Zn-dependent protease with chaperone function
MSSIQSFIADPERLARLEAEVARNPAAYRRKLAFAAVFGELTLNVMRLIPIAVPMFVGAAFLQHPVFFWVAAAATLLLWWLMQPDSRVEGCELTRDEAPRLFAEIDKLADKLQSRREFAVRLDESFNAGALETRGFLGLLGTRFVLILGVPLLASLSRDQLLAVVAHEFGHFSRRHGRLGHWLYRAREGWIAYAEQVSRSGSAFDRLAALYAEQFVPYFSTRCFVHSRRCEYEADADAAFAVGGTTMAEALTRIEVISRLWGREFARELSRKQAAESRAPGDFYQQFIEAAHGWPVSDLERWLADALKASATVRDTHPSLSQRLSALNEAARLSEVRESAGASLLGQHWRKILNEFNEIWLRDGSAEWVFEHQRIKHIDQPLLDAGDAEVRQWDIGRRLARARALRRIDGARGLSELRALHEQHPDDTQVSFALGAALVSDDDQAGVPILDAIARTHAGFRQPAYLRLLRFYERKGDETQMERLTLQLQRSVERRADAVAALFDKPESVQWRASSLADEAQNALAQSLKLDPAVSRAWLMETDGELVTSERGTRQKIKMHCMVLTTDPSELSRINLDLTGIAERYEQAITALIAPDEHVVVRAFFTTEPVPKTLAPLSQLLCGKE